MDKSTQGVFDAGSGLIVVFLVGLVVVSVVGYFYFPFAAFTAERDAGKQVVEDTYNAEQAVENYEWFRTQWRDIQAQRAIVQNQKDELDRFYGTYGEDPDDWSRTTKQRHSRIQTRITGSQNNLESMIAEYNARSDQANRALFKCSLPYQVDERFAVRGPPGSDSVETPNDQYVDGTSAGSVPQPENCDGLPNEIQREAASA